MLAYEYFDHMRSMMSGHIDSAIVEKRYEFINSSCVGSSIAQTANCWLNYPVLELDQKYHTVIASDEFFTYADQNSQQPLIEDVVACVEKRLIVTVRDFKNSHRADLNEMLAINQEDRTLLIVDHARSVVTDRQAWQHETFVMEHLMGSDPVTKLAGPVLRRAVYFKQLAKFCFDDGCKKFQVLPEVMFRPLFKKHSEHVIVADF